MSDDLSATIKAARRFLKKLKQNNNREWFQANKAEYEATIKEPGNLLGHHLSAKIEALTECPHTYKLFRINRDVRFSKDKTPYNTHVHLLWSAGEGPGFFFGLSHDYLTAGCGVMGLQKARLDAYRNAVDADGDALHATVNSLTDSGFRLEPPELKRVPAPFDKNHPHGELLKRKSLALWRDFQSETITQEDLTETFGELLPLRSFLADLS